MNTIGVVLSATALLVALVELRLRADLAGRRMCAILVTCSWLTMAGVAWDYHRQCRVLAARPTVPVARGISDTSVPELVIEWPDGAKLQQFASQSQIRSAEWRAKPNGRL
jgi:hypothetical protein